MKVLQFRGLETLRKTVEFVNVFLFASCSCSVLKDKLLTDSMMVINGEFPPVCTEHSYSLGRSGNGTGNPDTLTGNGAASDGDSIPESPLSLHDGKQHIFFFF